MYGYQVSAGYYQYIKLVSNKLNIPCGVYMIDKTAKYSLAKRGGTKGFYGYNLHYEWNK